MRKLIKIAAWCAAGVVVALLGAALALRVFFPPEKLKALALNWLSKEYKREFRIESVNAGLSGLTIKDLAVSEAGGFAKGEMLKAGKISASFKLAALLRKELLVNSVEADGIALNISKYKDGLFNFSDLLAAQKTQPAASAQQGEAAKKRQYSFAVSRVAVKNAAVSYRDVTGAVLSVKNISVASRDIALSRPYDISAEFDLDYPFAGKIIPLRVKTAVTADMTDADPAKHKIAVRDFKAAWNKLAITVSGEAENFNMPRGSFKCRVAPISTTQLAELFPQLPQHLPLPQTDISAEFELRPNETAFELKNLSVTGGPVSLSSAALIAGIGKNKKVFWTFRGAVKTNLPEFDTTMLARLAPAVPRGYKIPASEFAANIAAGDNNVFGLTGWELKAGSLWAKGAAGASLTAQGWSARATITSFKLSLADIAAIAPAYAEYKPAGTADGQLKVSWQQSGKLDYSGAIDISRAGAVWQKTKVSDVSTYIQLSAAGVEISHMSGKINGSAFSAGFNLANSPQVMKAQLTASVDTLDIAALLPPPAKAGAKPAEQSAKTAALPPLDLKMDIKIASLVHPNFTGKNAQARCDLTGITPALDRINGKASLDIKGGQIRDLTDFASGNKFAKIFLTPLAVVQKITKGAKLPFLPDFSDITYTAIEGVYEFNNGVMTVVKSDMNSSAAQVWTTGAINLPAQSMDMRVKLKLSGELGRYGSPVITARGNIFSPSVSVDAKSLLSDQVKQQAIDAGKKLLQNLFH